MAKLFEILWGEGLNCEQEDYIVRDEFGSRLASHRNLVIAFQLLSNEGKLATKWEVLRKEELRLKGGFNHPTTAMSKSIL
jgi:hypothetical protein